MATAKDVAAELAKLNHSQASALVKAPTRVVPGYNAAVGIAVDEAGHVLYMGTPTGASFLAEARVATSQTTATDGEIINFGTVNYDPGSRITTGASWNITLVAGWYQVIAGMSINSNTNVIAAHEYWDLALYDITHAAQIDTLDRLQHPTQINGGVSTSDFYISGSTIFHVASTITARCRFQTNQFTFGVDRTIDGGRFALLQVG